MRVLGELCIEPPLTLAEIKQSSFLSTSDGGTRVADVVLQLTQETRETDTEVVTVITCERAVPWTTSTYDAGNLLEDVKELVAECGERKVSGQMIAYDTEIWYVTRVVVDEDGVREEVAKMIWPDGTEVESLY
jgi:hypothetical protein